MEDQVILSFELPNYEESQKKIDTYTLSMLNLRNEIKVNNDENKKLEKQNKELQKQINAELGDRNKLTQQIQENNQKIKENTIVSSRMKDQVSELNKKRSDEIKIAKIQAGSLEEVRKKVSLLFKERDKLDLQSINGQKQFDILTKEIKEYQDQIQEADKSAGVFTSSIGNYSAGMSEAIRQTGLMSTPLGRLYAGFISIKDALQLNIKSLGFFKVALMSTGIGAIVVALGSLITYLTQTQRGMDFVNKTFEAGKAILSILIDRISLVGESIFKLVSGDFAGAWDALKKSVSDLGSEIENETTKAWKLEDAYQQLQDKQSKFLIERAKAERDIASLREKAKSLEEKNNPEALKYLQQAGQLQRSLLNTEIELAKEEARISEERLNLGESSREDIRQTDELKAKVFQLETSRLRELKSIEAEQLTLSKKVSTEDQKLNAKKLKDIEEFNKSKQLADDEAFLTKFEQLESNAEREKELLLEMDEFEDELREKQLEKEKEASDKKLEYEERLSEARQKLLDKGLSSIFKIIDYGYDRQETRISLSYDKRQKDLEKKLDQGLITEEQYQAQSQILEKQKARELYKIELARFKSQRIYDLSRVVIDTSRAVMKSIAESPLTFGLPWSGFAVAEGALQSATILAQPAPTPPQFAEGGTILQGASHENGGINLFDQSGRLVANAEGGEGIFVTKREATKSYLSQLNEKYGGKSFNNYSAYLREGGQIQTERDLSNQDLLSAISSLKIFVNVEDIQNGISDRNNILSAGVIS